MKKDYRVHLCGSDDKRYACEDVWVTADDDEDPETLALEQHPKVDAVRLLFNEDGTPIIREEN